MNTITTISLKNLYLSTDMMTAEQISDFVNEKITDNVPRKTSDLSNDQFYLSSETSSSSQLSDEFIKYQPKGDYLSSSQDYTAFEVFPTNIEIPGKVIIYDQTKSEDPELSDTILSTFSFIDGIIQDVSSFTSIGKHGETITNVISSTSTLFNWADEEKSNMSFTNLTYNYSVPVNDVLSIHMYSHVLKQNSDVIIDFGDGQKLTVKKDTVERYDDENSENWKNDKTSVITILHKYTGNNLNKKHIVKITGKDFDMIRLDNRKVDDNFTYDCIASRCFEYDLPFGSNVLNTSSFIRGSRRFLKIKTPYMTNNNIRNFSYMFSYCYNLQNVEIDQSLFRNQIYACAGMFTHCYSLKYSNVKLPTYVQMYRANLSSEPENLASFYSYCSCLNVDISSLIPENGFCTSKVYLNGTFYNCSNLHGTVPSDILWNNRCTMFNHIATFTNCSQDILNQVPFDWASDQGKLEQKYIINFDVLSDLNEIKTKSIIYDEYQKFIVHDNLFDKSSICLSGYYYADGKVKFIKEDELSDCQYSEQYIKIDSTKTYKANFPSGKVFQICTYDKNLNFLERKYNTYNLNEFTFDSNTQYVRMSTYKFKFNDDFMFQEKDKFPEKYIEYNTNINGQNIKDSTITLNKLSSDVTNKFNEYQISGNYLSSNTKLSTLEGNIDKSRIENFGEYGTKSEVNEISCNLSSIDGKISEFIIKSPNLFDSSYLSTGFYFNSDGSLAKSTNGQFTLNYIEVEPDTIYKFPYFSLMNMQICTYKSDKTFIERINFGASKTEMPFNSDVKYVRMSNYNANFSNEFMFCKKDEYPNSYKSCHNYLNISNTEPELLISNYQSKPNVKYLSNSDALEIKIPTSKGFIKYILVHDNKPAINCNTWRLNEVCHFNDKSTKYTITNGGEIEMAIKLKDRPDFSGGRAHGDEVMTKNVIVLDGRVINDFSSLSNILSNEVNFDSFTFRRYTDIYDPLDNVSIYAKHKCDYMFDDKNMILDQTVEFLSNETVIQAYLPMFTPKKRLYSSTSGDYVTDSIYFNDDFENTQEIVLPITRTDVSSVNMYSNISKFSAKIKILEQTGTQIKNKFNLSDNGNQNYNKLYNCITEAGTEINISAGTIWQIKSEFNLQQD